MKERLPMLRATVIALGLALSFSQRDLAAQWKLDQMVGKDPTGAAVYHARPVDERFRNPWPEAYEREFQARARKIIAAQSELSGRGTTYFESEKRFYGYLMAQALGPRGMEAVRDLQAEDVQGKSWHQHTAGIDYYACFTLKHQVTFSQGDPASC